MDSLDLKGYVPAFTMEIPKEPDSNENIKVELGTLKQTGFDDFCTVSYPLEKLEDRPVEEVAVPLDELKLSSILDNQDETKKYVATTDNKKLALSQLIEAIKNKKNRPELEIYLKEIFFAKTVDQWCAYMKELFVEIVTLMDSINNEGAEAGSDESKLEVLKKLTSNLKALDWFSKIYSARWNANISAMTDIFNDSMPEVKKFLTNVNNQGV